MFDSKWKNIQMTAATDPGDIDYYVIINSPPADVHYVPEKTIVFQMEPWVEDPSKNWGVKTWGEWATPDPQKFFKVFTPLMTETVFQSHRVFIKGIYL